MPKSYRIRTTVDGQQDTDKTIRVQIDQDFDFLEVLSLKLTQSDVYRRFCSDYGVIVGRVVANGGFGVPNARVSVFVPLDEVDESDPVISTLYPYKSPADKNEDGYRYNLLPYTPSYDGHKATGTFPTREDVLTRKEVLQIYEKYYKYTVKTNESGDYMIVGVPLGNQQVFLDVDLSDMGCFSLRPTDLIRGGLATESQFDGNQFKTSSDLASLPQIVSQSRSISVSSFWGVGDQCDVGITRVDFDLRNSNIAIEPVATFMGSIMSSGKNTYLRNTCRVGTEQGDLCGMVAGPGRILAIRQTINTDSNGDPILEQYQLEQGGKVIDDNGAFVVDVPMNLDYVTTNEFGELVLSDDPKIGIPTKGKYRFKIKWEDGEKEIAELQTAQSILGPNLLNLSGFNPKGVLLRANYLVPNIKEYGWENSNEDPNELTNDETDVAFFGNESQRTQEYISTNYPSKSSVIIERIEGQFEKYEVFKETGQNTNVFEAVTSKWIDLDNGGRIKINVTKKSKSISFNSGTRNLVTYRTVRINLKKIDYRKALLQKSYSFSLDWNDYPDKQEAISCRDFFYEFNYNKVYTTAQFIDEYRNESGLNRGRFLSIKEILDRSCESEVNKFPINDGVRNFDLLYFIISILFFLLTIVGSILLIVYHLVKYLWNNFAPFILATLIGVAYKNSFEEFQLAVQSALGSAQSFGATFLLILPFLKKGLLWLAFGTAMLVFFKTISKFKFPSLRLPMITYPDCSTCDCGDNDFGISTNAGGGINSSPLANINQPGEYKVSDSEEISALVDNIAAGIGAAGRSDVDDKEPPRDDARTPVYNVREDQYFWAAQDKKDNPGGYYLTVPEKINLFNTKGHYFFQTGGGGTNRIKVFPNYEKNKVGNNEKHYYDQPLIVLVDPDQMSNFVTGNLLSFVNPNNTKDVNVLNESPIKNGLNTFSVTGTTTPSGETQQINITYANFNNYSSSITETFNVKQTLYDGKASYNFPSDIEYLQVITAMTFSQVEELYNQKTKYLPGQGYSFIERVMLAKTRVVIYQPDPPKKQTKERVIQERTVLYDFENFKKLGVVFLMKGVDPYTTRQKTKIDISLPLGLTEKSIVVESNYKLNIPIQPGLLIPRHDKLTQNNTVSSDVPYPLFHPSYIFTPSTGLGEFKYSAYTTNNHTYYSNYDASLPSNKRRFSIVDSTTGNLTTGSANQNFSNGANSGPNRFNGTKPHGYFENEYVEGGSLMCNIERKVTNKNPEFAGGWMHYERTVYSTASTVNMVDNTKIIMRTDRLPRSDEPDFDFTLAQNKNFAVYFITDDGIGTKVEANINSTDDFSTDQSSDFQSAYGSGTTSIMTTFNCSSMVPLGAYEQNAGESIRLKNPQDDVYYTSGDKDYPIMKNGCYRLVEKDLAIGADLKAFTEWRIRFLLGFALCRNVFGMTFTNQWINGVLYMPSFQNDKIYPSLDSKFPIYNFCKEKIVFREENNSFFYRSSPFSQNGNFIGMKGTIENPKVGSNKYFIGNPTTIVDLGPKDNIIKFVCAKPEFQGYNLDRLEPTTFQDVSNLAQMFIVSRFINSKFLQRTISFGTGAISQFFSRDGQKIDGDFAQLNSINSEIGVSPFTPETYTDKNIFFGVTPNPVLGIFFTADTVTRDFVTPGREIFIDTPSKFAYNYFGINSQIVPMYRWKTERGGELPSLFGSEKNSWVTDSASNFAIQPYQGIDRLRPGTYYQSSVNNPTTQKPGFIYNSSPSPLTGPPTGYTYNGYSDPKTPDTFIVGAPFHFYFGLKAGKTAYDIFVKKNLIDL